MAEIQEQLENIEFKIKQLARKVELIKEENNQLVKENTELRELLHAKEMKGSPTQQTIMEFEGKSEDENETKKKMRAELDNYIQEIEACIELLENV